MRADTEVVLRAAVDFGKVVQRYVFGLFANVFSFPRSMSPRTPSVAGHGFKFSSTIPSHADSNDDSFLTTLNCTRRATSPRTFRCVVYNTYERIEMKFKVVVGV